jgi:hypothetical protein
VDSYVLTDVSDEIAAVIVMIVLASALKMKEAGSFNSLQILRI